MAEQKNIEAIEAEVLGEASANPQADAPKKNAAPAEPMKSIGSAEDLGSAVVKPTDSNPDASKKISPVSGDPQQKAQGAADAMPKLKEEEEADKADKKDSEVKEGEMPKAALDALKKSQDKEKKEESDEDKKDMKEESDEDTIDVSADVEALTKDEDLSEDFKAKAATIFEAAVNSKVKEAKEKLKAGYEEKLKEDLDTKKAELVEKVDSYLNYVVEEWMQENKIAIERGIKGEIAEDFISGLKKLFEDHYIDVPDEKYDVLEDQASKIENLEAKLNEEIEKNVEMNKANSELKRQDIIDEASADLADTAKEKFNKLAEEVEFSNEEDFKTKVSTLKESYFGKKEVASNEVDELADANGETDPLDLTNSMAAYTAAISKTKDIKLVK
jgi:hypothetical protein|tara:strand:- start:13688 stop:14848 length:1161 start_codon:yes stop_codon:yes gene_type:complete